MSNDFDDFTECVGCVAGTTGGLILIPFFIVGLPFYGAGKIIVSGIKKINKSLEKKKLIKIRNAFINTYCTTTLEFSVGDLKLDMSSCSDDNSVSFNYVLRNQRYSWYFPKDWLKLPITETIIKLYDECVRKETVNNNRISAESRRRLEYNSKRRTCNPITKIKLHEILEMVEESNMKDQKIIDISNKLKTIYESI